MSGYKPRRKKTEYTKNERMVMEMKFNNEFSAIYNAHEMSVIKRLAEIEQEDANACANCGGEDCICCEIYRDRMNWVSAEELFSEDFDPWSYDEYYPDDDDYDEEESEEY